MNMMMQKTLSSLLSHIEMDRNELDSRCAIVFLFEFYMI